MSGAAIRLTLAPSAQSTECQRHRQRKSWFGLLAVLFLTSPATTHAGNKRPRGQQAKSSKNQPRSQRTTQPSRRSLAARSKLVRPRLSRAVAANQFPRSRPLFPARGDRRSYQEAFGKRLTRRLQRLNRKGKPLTWLDGGAGVGVAQRQGVEAFSHLRAVSVTLSDDAPDSSGRHRVLKKPVHALASDHSDLLGTVDVITDFFGAVSYSDPAAALATYGAMLRPGGELYVSIDAGTRFTRGETEMGARSWLDQASGLRVVSYEDHGGYATAVLRRTRGPARIPALHESRHREAGGGPPFRTLSLRENSWAEVRGGDLHVDEN